MRCFIIDSACPVCKTEFVARLRVQAHLSDPRRDRCRSAIIADMDAFQRLNKEELSRLDELDREARKAARKEGHTHAIAVSSAFTAQGKRIGHVSR